MDGWIYILSNKAFADGRIKIGCSSKDPNARKEELESSGVPEEFHLEYRALVSSFSLVETKVHKALTAHRPNKNREFFTCSIPTAINTIREIVGEPEIKYEEVLYENPEEIEKKRLYKVLLEQEEQKTIARQAQERVRQEKVKARREEEKAQKAKEAEARTKRLEERAEREDQKHRNKVAIWILILWVIGWVYVFLNTPGL